MTFVLIMWFSINDQWQMESVQGFASIPECNVAAAQARKLIGGDSTWFARTFRHLCVAQTTPQPATVERSKP